MKLSQDIIFYYLQEAYETASLIPSKSSLNIGRPRFYEPEVSYEDSLVVLEYTDWETLDRCLLSSSALVYCVADAEYSLPEDCACIQLPPDTSIHHVFNLLQSVYDRYDHLHKKIDSLLTKNADMHLFMKYCQDLLPEPMLLMDPDFYTVCCTEDHMRPDLTEIFMDNNRNLPVDTSNIIFNDTSFLNSYRKKDAFYLSHHFGHMVIKNLYFEKVFVGRLIIMISGQTVNNVPFYKALLEHLAPYAAMTYADSMWYRRKSENLEQLKVLFLQTLQGQTIPADEWNSAVSQSGWSTTDGLQLVQLITTPPSLEIQAKYLIREIKSLWQGCICLEYDKSFLLIINTVRFHSRNGKGFMEELPYFLRDNLLHAALARPITRPEHIHSAFMQTVYAFEFGRKKDPFFWYFIFDDYACNYLIKYGCGIFDREMICSTKLLELAHYDSVHETSYYETLKAYFYQRFNAVAAAKSLFIHRSTFINRMAKIQEMISLQLDSPDELLYLYFSFKLLS